MNTDMFTMPPYLRYVLQQIEDRNFQQYGEYRVECSKDLLNRQIFTPYKDSMQAYFQTELRKSIRSTNNSNVAITCGEFHVDYSNISLNLVLIVINVGMFVFCVSGSDSTTRMLTCNFSGIRHSRACIVC